MNTLERDALEALDLIRFVKNSFAPVNRIPPEVLSLIPEYDDDDDDDDRGWRDTFIPRSSLWIQLDFKNVDKTRTYIQHLKSSPLELHLERDEDSAYFDDMFFLATPTYPPNQIPHHLCGSPTGCPQIFRSSCPSSRGIWHQSHFSSRSSPR